MRAAFATSFLLAVAASSVAAQDTTAASSIASSAAPAATPAPAVPAGGVSIMPHTVLPHIECGPDILIDDFKVSNYSKLPFPEETINRYLNLLGADYGQGPDPTKSLNFTIDTAKGVNRITSLVPKDATGQGNFFFAKFDAGACFDLTNFFAVGFDLVGPTGGTFTLTLTQKSPDCQSRLPDDSDYIPITRYTNPNGQKQAVVIPFSDFKKNVKGANFDFVHLKDWTLNEFLPQGSVWEISNLRLIRACKNNGPYGTNTTVGTVGPAAQPAPGTGTTNGGGAAGSTGTPATDPAKSSAGKALYGIGTIIAGAIAAFMGAF